MSINQMTIKQFINYIAVDICESLNLYPDNQTTTTIEQIILTHTDSLCVKYTLQRSRLKNDKAHTSSKRNNSG